MIMKGPVCVLLSLLPNFVIILFYQAPFQVHEIQKKIIEVMDVHLLRTLQSIKQIEDDPSLQFQTNKIDLDSFIPKYQNVVLVDQQWHQSQLMTRMVGTEISLLPPGILSPEIPSTGKRLITNKLTVALEFVFGSYLGKVTSEWTVILKDGLFINPLNSIRPFDAFASHKKSDFLAHPHLLMEIVGLQDVRILLDHDHSGFFASENINLTMRNMRIYDYRPNPCKAVPVLGGSPECYLEDVKIHAPQVPGVICRGPGSRVFLKGCSLNILRLEVFQGVFHAENCLITGHHESRFLKGTSLFADHVSFRGYGIIVQFTSSCVLEGCKFDAIGLSVNKPAVDVCTNSKVDCRGTTFSGYLGAIRSTGSSSTALLRHCHFYDGQVSCTSFQNANVTLTDSFLQTEFLFTGAGNLKSF